MNKIITSYNKRTLSFVVGNIPNINYIPKKAKQFNLLQRFSLSIGNWCQKRQDYCFSLTLFKLFFLEISKKINYDEIKCIYFFDGKEKECSFDELEKKLWNEQEYKYYQGEGIDVKKEDCYSTFQQAYFLKDKKTVAYMQMENCDFHPYHDAETFAFYGVEFKIRDLEKSLYKLCQKEKIPIVDFVIEKELTEIEVLAKKKKGWFISCLTLFLQLAYILLFVFYLKETHLFFLFVPLALSFLIPSYEDKENIEMDLVLIQGARKRVVAFEKRVKR